MKQREIDFKNKLKKVESIDGDGTQLVSLYIPSDSNINRYSQRVQDEIAEAGNIKSKETKKKVQSSLNKIASVLKGYKKLQKMV